MTTKADADTKRLSPEMTRKITEYANTLAWRKPDLNVLRPELNGQYSPIAETMQQHIKRADRRKKLVLPDLRAFNNETVAVFTDYGGESKEANYLVYSTLICGWNLTHSFLERMKVVRQRHGLGLKEIAFKDFGMGQVQRSLPDYLAALNLVPGFLFTLAVDKRLTSLFGPQGKAARERIARLLTDAGLGERKPSVNEKLLRVVHVAAFLTGLLAHDGQRIFWMTDHDAISPTPKMHEKTLTLFHRALQLYTRKGCTFRSIDGAFPFEDRSLGMHDLLSATDIVAGSLDQYLRQIDSVSTEQIEMKQGGELVLQWLARDGIGLKKMNVTMKPGDNETIRAATLEFDLTTPPNDPIIISVVV